MSGTAYGTVVLHVSPRPRPAGRSALVRTGDVIVLDVAARRLDVDVTGRRARRAGRPTPATVAAFAAADARMGAAVRRHRACRPNTGADLDFLVGASGDQVSRESH